LSGQLRPLSNKQRGQAIVFVLLFMAILLVSAFALFKAGKITSNKMQLQNAADAAAFSMSTVEARDLNFAAYMNRAIVANEVAIGQLVGMASWAVHFKSYADFVDTYDSVFLSPATLGVSSTIIKPITTAWRSGGLTAVRIMSKIANIGTLVLHNINKAYGGAVFGYHTISVFLATGVLNDVIAENAPPGTKISDFGILTLIAHVATYGVIPNLPNQFATGYLPTKKTTFDKFKAQDSGYARLAALIRDSRDPFTRERGWEVPLFETILGDPIDETLEVEIGIDAEPLFSATIGFEFKFAIEITLGRYGGSELRMVIPASTTAKKAWAKGFNWSAADTTQLALDLAVSMKLWAEACVLTICAGADITGAIKLGGDELEMYVEILGEKIYLLPTPLGIIPSIPPLPKKLPFPTIMPFSAGFAEVGKTPTKPNTIGNNLGSKHMLQDFLPNGVISPDHYGGAATGKLAWNSPGPGPLPPAGILSLSELYQVAQGTMVNKKYGGLPHYVDTTGKQSFLEIGAPNLVIALIQKEDPDYDTYHSADRTKVYDSEEPAGRLRLNEAFADDELAVVAKSELYFSRPSDKFAMHFLRNDGYTELGSAFNPFWQARLIDTNYVDRTMALGIQQKQDFINVRNSWNTVVNTFSSFLPF
jgi:hypothetical protein